MHILDGNAEDLQKECYEYERKIMDAGGVDLFIGGMCTKCILQCINSSYHLLSHVSILEAYSEM